MPSFRQILEVITVGLAATASALPGQPKVSSRALRAYDISARAATSTGLPAGLTDVDILQLYVPALVLFNLANDESAP
jgi:hypothetical protein